MKPIPPNPKSAKEEKTKLIFICNRGKSRFWNHIFARDEFVKDDIFHGSIDRNSKMSSFEEG